MDILLALDHVYKGLNEKYSEFSEMDQIIRKSDEKILLFIDSCFNNR